LSSVVGVEEIVRNINRWSERTESGIFALADIFGKGTLERYAKLNRKWKDRTSSARNGLHGGAYKKSGNIHIYIAHRVHYGVYLEKGMSGRYAILLPTIRANKSKLSRAINNFINS